LDGAAYSLFPFSTSSSMHALPRDDWKTQAWLQMLSRRPQDRRAESESRATAAFARGRVAMARGDAAAASELQKAINYFAVLGLRLDAARSRLALARTLASESPEIAIDTARQARNELDALGDSREADIAAALMRSLGAKGRAGPRAAGLLTQREIEVLRLLGEGLTNAEIAARLFISPKTAEHHVSRIFAKLGLSKRSEAAAYAVRHLEAE
jgi:DNA-binding NarL/FixJ family response regulator